MPRTAMQARRGTGLSTWLLLAVGRHGASARREEGVSDVLSASEAEGGPRSCIDSWSRLKDFSHWKVKVVASSAKFVGEGANGCAYIAKAQAGGDIVIKTSKWSNRLKLFENECKSLQTVHTTACTQAGGESSLPTPIALAEQYVPTCLEVGGTKDDPYIVQQMAKGGPWEPTNLQVQDQKAVFAQLVEAVFALHRLGFAHNDMTIGNVYLDKTTSPPRVALIDLGDMTTLDKIPSAYRSNYKRDANAIWERSQALIGCEERPSQGASKQDVDWFLDCIKAKWWPEHSITPTPEMEEFRRAVSNMLYAGVEKSENQHIESLYETAKVQEWLPSHKQLYHWTDCAPQSSEFFIAEEGTTPRPATTTRSGTVRRMSGSLLAAGVVLVTVAAHLVQ